MKKISLFLFPYLILSLVCFWLFCSGINSIPTLDRDEALYTQASKQMLESHDFAQVNFQEEPRHLKPPGIYWLQAGLVKFTTGENSTAMWPYRLVSVLGAWIAVLGLFYFWRESLGDRIALLAASFLAMSLLLNIEVHMANTDSVLLASVVLMQGGLWKSYEAHRLGSKPSYINTWIFWLAMSLGILIKGITPLVGLLCIIFTLIFDRSFEFWKSLRPVSGISTLILLTALWLVPMSIAGHSNFLWDMVHGDVIPKLVSGQESHGAWPGYFLTLLPLFLIPVSLWIPEGIKLAWLDRRKIHMRFLLAWLMPTWIFFECIPTKLPQYVLPVFPALVLILSLALLRRVKIENFYWKKLTQVYQIIYLILIFALATVLVILPHRIEGVYSLWSFIAAMSVILLGVSAWMGVRLNSLKLSLVSIILLGLILWPIIFAEILPEMKDFWLTEKLVRHLKHDGVYEKLSANSPLLISGYNEPSVVFNLGTYNVHEVGIDALPKLIATTNYAAIVILKTQWPVLLAHTQIPMRIVDEMDGFRYNGGHWQTLLVLERSKE